jgi:hypothetical protein
MPLADLRAALTAAFAAARHPGDDALVSGDVSYDPEYRDVAKAFAGKHWSDLSFRFVHDHRDALPLLTPAAFRFFVPAYLLACLEHPWEVDTAPLSVARCLTAPTNPTAARAFADLFNDSEAKAVLECLSRLAALEIVPEAVIERALAHWQAHADRGPAR